MGVMSEFFRSPYEEAAAQVRINPRVLPGASGMFDDGLVEPGADLGAPISVQLIGDPFDAVGGPMDGSDLQGPSANFMAIGHDVDPEGYVAEAERLVDEFLPHEPTTEERLAELRDALRTRPWFRILCDAKLMVDESRAAWAGRRHRALVALGLRRDPKQHWCSICEHEEHAAHKARHATHAYRPLHAYPSIGDFAAPGINDWSAPTPGDPNLSFAIERVSSALESIDRTLNGRSLRRQPFMGQPYASPGSFFGVPVVHVPTAPVVQAHPPVSVQPPAAAPAPATPPPVFTPAPQSVPNSPETPAEIPAEIEGSLDDKIVEPAEEHGPAAAAADQTPTDVPPASSAPAATSPADEIAALRAEVNGWISGLTKALDKLRVA